MSDAIKTHLVVLELLHADSRSDRQNGEANTCFFATFSIEHPEHVAVTFCVRF
jgi:hypothetical protein